MNYEQQTKVCQNCSNTFTIEPEDFAFYDKINVPAPTFCSECRLQRQFAFRNERALYKRKCGAPDHEENLITIYSEDKPIKVYDQKYWWSDSWDALEYGREYDFSESFFNQFKEFIQNVPWPNLAITNSVNSDYCNSVLGLKNSYLIFGAVECENSMYGTHVDHTKDVIDIDFSVKNELCYEITKCNECYKLNFSAFSIQCTNSSFLVDCRSCSYCFGCVGLRNKQYHIFNQPYSKEKYLEKLKELDTGSFKIIDDFKNKFKEFSLKYPYKFARLFYTINSTGDNSQHLKNCYMCFDAQGEGVEDSRHMYMTYGKPVKDSHSIYALSEGELCYESISIRHCNNVLFSKKVWDGHHIQYSLNCHNCNNLFGCVGLRKKQYCILNKQYSKEEYEVLVPKIIQHMNDMPYIDKKGRIYKYGEFFPIELSPFAYNETIAQEYLSLSKEGAVELGFTWKNPEDRNNTNITVKNQDLPNHIKDVDDSILTQIIQCSHAVISDSSASSISGQSASNGCNEQCTQAFKIIASELEFYRKMNLPLPRLCPNCRHYQRIKQRNPMKLWKRKCMCDGKESVNSNQGTGKYQNTATHSHGDQPCPNEFETTYAPDRPEIVYCESCYQSEVV